MNRQALQKMISQRLRELNRNFRELKESISVDAVHDFRVAVKKERAMLRLMSVNKDRQIKISNDLKNIYKKSGDVRELHVLLINNKKRRIFSRFQTNQWRQRIKARSAELKDWMKNISLTGDRKYIIHQLPVRLSLRDIEFYFSEKLKEIKSLLSLDRINATIMHNIRKLIKDLLYCAQILEAEARYRLPSSVWSRERQEYFSRIASDLGEYHDRFMETTFLEKKEKQTMNKELQKIKKQLLDSLRKNI